jgi:hypothetical protein
MGLGNSALTAIAAALRKLVPPEDQPWREQIIVPFCWESLAAWGEGDAASSENYYAMRVFRNPAGGHTPESSGGAALRGRVVPPRSLKSRITPAWKDKRVILTIGAADFFTDGWCNGQHLGHHEGGYTPFEFDLTDALSTGFLTRQAPRRVLVLARGRSHGQPRAARRQAMVLVHHHQRHLANRLH